MPDKSKIWFPSKTYGWGLPCAWQGWVVFLIYFLLLILGWRWDKPG